MDYIIKPMQTVDEIDGKGYVHYKSWQETYAGLIDAEYLKNMTEEKCKAIAQMEGQYSRCQGRRQGYRFCRLRKIP